MGLKHFKLQLADLADGKNITATGGKCYVAKSGDTAKQTLYTAAGASLSNPITLTNGMIEFWTADTVVDVDLYGYGPKGHGFIAKDVVASGNNEIWINQMARSTELVIPFSIGDTTATTETDTGFDLIAQSQVMSPGSSVEVTAIDATETIDVGILSSESGGDANGFAAAVAVGVLGTIPAIATVTAGVVASTTAGALICDFAAGTNADDRGIAQYKTHVCDGTAKSITYTLTAGSDTAKGFIRLPVVLPVS